MKNISLIVGDTCDLPQKIIQEKQMVVVPYIINWEEGLKINGENIYEKMRRSETLPKTSQPSPLVFKNVFEKELAKANEVFCITLSSKLSGGYNCACLAKKMLPLDDQKRIWIFDSYHVAGSEGLLNLRAAKLIQEGKTAKEIEDDLIKNIPEIYLIGMIEDPKWLEGGGRISSTLASLIRQMAKVGFRPVLGIKEGEVKPIALKMKAKNIPEAIFKHFEKKTKAILQPKRRIQAAISYTDKNDEAQKLKELLENSEGVEIIFENILNNVIGCHVGPGSLLLSWREIQS